MNLTFKILKDNIQDKRNAEINETTDDDFL